MWKMDKTMKLLKRYPEVVRCESGWSLMLESPPDGSPPAVFPPVLVGGQASFNNNFLFFNLIGEMMEGSQRCFRQFLQDGQPFPGLDKFYLKPFFIFQQGATRLAFLFYNGADYLFPPC